MRLTTLALVLASPLAIACAGEVPSPAGDTFEGPGLAVNVAALNLSGVGDVVWDLEVQNGATPAQTVWQRRISSSGYGDGAGSASYIGPCDADANPNKVRVWVVGVFTDAVTTLGTFSSGAAGGVTGNPTAFQNPTATAPLERTVVCAENTDVAVQFDVALMRPAQQGFFDIAVNFSDIFCSAKLDCVPELLHRAGGGRDLTAVLGFACTSGSADSCLYTAPVTLDCGPGATWTLDPSQGPGNIPEDSPLLFGAAVYQGDEEFTAFRKSYWNVALGLDETQFATYPDCTLSWSGTAAEGELDGAGPFTTPAGTLYPFIAWERDIIVAGALACSAHPLNTPVGGESTASVASHYTSLTTPESFAYTNCEPNSSCACPAGFTANPAGDGCARLTTVAATLESTTYTVCAGDLDGSYSMHGTRFSLSTTPGDFEIPPSGDPLATCSDPAVCIRETSIGVGRLGTVGVWACSGSPNLTYIGFSQCLDLATGGDFLVGIAGDNAVRFEVDGTLVYESVSSLNFRSWNVLRVPLTSGQHIIELFGLNQGGFAAFGAEIWGPFPAGTLSTPALMRDAYVAALAAPGQPLRVFSTEPMRTASPVESFDTSVDGTSGYSCPTAQHALNLCGGGAPTCTLLESAACQ